jgi:uncharacterized membrane protein YbhN (UPF0104 family)
MTNAIQLSPTLKTSRARTVKLALIGFKLVVTGACFWYIAHSVDFSKVFSGISHLDLRWASLATALILFQTLISATRWGSILAALDVKTVQVALIAATAVGTFFAQILPSGASEGVRAWLLVRLGCDWRRAIASVVIDRAVGVALLIAIGFCVLLFSSADTGLGRYREISLLVLGGVLVASLLGLLLVPLISPLLVRYKFSSWLGTLANYAHRALLGPTGPIILVIGCVIHALTIAAIWALGQAVGIDLSGSQSAVLFTCIVGASILPISVGGWGVREMIVINLLGSQGISPETALLLSASFGLSVAVAALPGGLAWILYPFTPSARLAPI